MKRRNSTSFWYKAVNTDRISIYDYLDEYTSKFYRLESINLLRLRMGHTKISHGFLFNANFTPFCDYSNTTAPIFNHILCDCPLFTNIRLSIYHNTNPLTSLSNPTTENTAKLIKFLKITKLFYDI